MKQNFAGKTEEQWIVKRRKSVGSHNNKNLWKFVQKRNTNNLALTCDSFSSSLTLTSFSTSVCVVRRVRWWWWWNDSRVYILGGWDVQRNYYWCCSLFNENCRRLISDRVGSVAPFDERKYEEDEKSFSVQLQQF